MAFQRRLAVRRDEHEFFDPGFARFVDGFNAGLAGDSVEIAYALGLQYGLQVGQDTLGTIDRELFLSGVRSGLNGDSLRLSPEQFQAAQAIVEDSVSIRQIRARAKTDDAAARTLTQIGNMACPA